MDDRPGKIEASAGPEPAPQAPAGKAMQLWVIEAAAPPTDSRWQDRSIWRQVIVAASSPIFARLTAERWALPNPPPQIGNESDAPQAGFLDEKLYHVRRAPPELAAAAAPGSGEARVLDAHLLREPPSIIEI